MYRIKVFNNMGLRKLIQTTIRECLNEQINTNNIKYFGEVNLDEKNWLVRTGRKSYSGGELTPIFHNNTMIGGISWNLGGIDYLEFLPEYKNKGFLKYVVYDNIDNGIVKFVSASDELKDKLSNYGDIKYDENNDTTTVFLNKTYYKSEM